MRGHSSKEAFCDELPALWTTPRPKHTNLPALWRAHRSRRLVAARARNAGRCADHSV